MAAKAETLGAYFRERLREIRDERVVAIRGKGMMNAIEVDNRDGFSAKALAVRLRDAGLLSKVTHKKTLRLTPPLCITRDQVVECADIIKQTLRKFK